MEVKQFIGLDVGSKRTGIARASSVAALAQPLKTVATDQLEKALTELTDDDVAAIVVGLPRSLQGDDTAQTTWVRQWVTDAKSKINKPFYWQDEALTTVHAASQKFSGKNNPGIDALSAAIILQDFMDTAETERVLC